MATYIYDGSFAGLLTCIFTLYQTKTMPGAIVTEARFQPLLFDDSRVIITDEQQAARVLRGLAARTDEQVSEMLYKMFLSELPAMEMDMVAFVDAIVCSGKAVSTQPDRGNPGREKIGSKKIGNGKNSNARSNYGDIRRTISGDNAPCASDNVPVQQLSILQNYANPAILKAAQIVKMMHREIHRMHAFVRFLKSQEGIFYSVIEPDFNVLPLIAEHFERRYADQPWIIFDARRHYGLYYNLAETVAITRDDPVLAVVMGQVQDNKESLYQQLWVNYFRSVNIPARNNVKLHLRQLPKRYWKNLTEKNGSC